jgi:hypothetical protein
MHKTLHTSFLPVQAELDSPAKPTGQGEGESSGYREWLHAKVEHAVTQADRPDAVRLSTGAVRRRLEGLLTALESRKHAASRLA